MSLFIILVYSWLGVGLICGLLSLYVAYISKGEFEEDLNSVPNNPFESKNMVMVLFVIFVIGGYLSAAILISVGLRRFQE